MGELVNLSKARKARAERAARTGAAVNRAAFGRTKTERAAEKAEKAKAARDLDGKARDD